jgi:hypothetical protein
MAASRERVDLWIEIAKSTKSKYIISVCDTFDHEDYPVFCGTTAELARVIKRYDNNDMQRINEIIQINGDDVIENLTIIDI